MRLSGLFALLLLTLHSTAAWADEALLQKADLAFDDLEFAQAAALYQEALKKPGSREQRAHAYRGLGLSLAFLGDAAGARENFEAMLLVDPTAKVNVSLGPKIARPFEAARKSLRGKRAPEVKIARDDRTGTLTAKLSAKAPVVDEVVLYATAGENPTPKEARSSDVATLEFPPHVTVRAWAEAQDEGQGVLLATGSAAAPLEFKATARPPPAVAAAVEEARSRQIPSRTAAADEDPPSLEPDELTVESSGSRWPLWVGGAVAIVGGGVAAAMLLNRPEPLQLPAADRTGRLP